MIKYIKPLLVKEEKMWQKIKCFFGFHKITHWHSRYGLIVQYPYKGCYADCECCPKRIYKMEKDGEK